MLWSFPKKKKKVMLWTHIMAVTWQIISIPDHGNLFTSPCEFMTRIYLTCNSRRSKVFDNKTI